MMSRYSFIRWTTLTLTLGVTACGQDASFTTLTTVPEEEVSQLPTGCGDLTDVSDDELMWSRAEGNAAAIVLDTPSGACVDSRERVVVTLSQQHRDELAALIQHTFTPGDPAPHPDLSAGGTISDDPSPHPDKPQGTAEGDPQPHPDKNTSDDKDDKYAVLIVAPIVVGNVPSGGDGTPPPPPPPTPAGASAE